MLATESKKPLSEAQRYFRPRRLGHVNLYVADLDRSMDFYTKVIGIEESYRTPLGGGGFVSNGNTHHDVGFTDAFGALGKPRGAKPGEVSHIAFELESEVELVDAYEKATQAGVTFLRTVDHDIAHSVYGRDPEGVVYELYADVVKDWRTHRTGIVTKPKPAWKPGMTQPVKEPRYHVDPQLRRVADAIFHPLRTTHAVIAVSDMQKTLEYYTTVIGLEADPACRDKPFAVLKGSCGERSVVLIPAAAAGRAGYHHAALQVGSVAELDASLDKARSAGIRSEADLFHCGRRAALLRDPDGCLVRLYADEAAEPAVDQVDPALAPYIL
jgi:catechol 2,3-dioxygenase